MYLLGTYHSCRRLSNITLSIGIVIFPALAPFWFEIPTPVFQLRTVFLFVDGDDPQMPLFATIFVPKPPWPVFALLLAVIVLFSDSILTVTHLYFQLLELGVSESEILLALLPLVRKLIGKVLIL